MRQPVFLSLSAASRDLSFVDSAIVPIAAAIVAAADITDPIAAASADSIDAIDPHRRRRFCHHLLCPLGHRPAS